MPKPMAWEKADHGAPHHIGTCPTTGKRSWGSKKAAKREARRFDRTMHPYWCDHCHWWHLGHLAPNIRRGQIDRATAYGSRS